jgi:3-dehydroquinate synthase
MANVKIRIAGRDSAYKIKIGKGLLSGAGSWATACLHTRPGRIAIVSNPAVFNIYGEVVEQSLTEAGFSVSRFLMKDGERHKSYSTAEGALTAFCEAGLTRTDAVVALGGGVVGDLAGFAAAMYLRGIAFLQVPTTLLAMIDSSVGGKTGVNTPFGKNLVGAFHQPSGVLIDVDTLSTLPSRELTAGLCEMVKHGAISGRSLLGQTHEFLSSGPKEFERPDLRSRTETDGDVEPNQKPRKPKAKDRTPKTVSLIDLIAANVEFKAKIVAGDEREAASNMTGRSRKILNFGHTLAHALEKVTSYKYFKHGEAVGYGVLFAAELSKSLALCDEKVVKSLNDVVQCVGPLPPLANIDGNEVFEAFKFDKKQLSGSLQFILLKDIGKPVILTEKDIPRTTVQKVLKKLLQKWA